MNDSIDIEAGAIAMRRQADLVLDGVEPWSEIPDTWAYAMLAVAGWLETEVMNLNARTRPYADAIAKAFIHGAEKPC